MDVKDNFDVEYYLERLYRDPADKERGVQPFRMRCFYEFYKKFSSSWNVHSAQLLEYGGGPIIYPLVSACPYVGGITFSDFQQASLDAVSMWKDKSEGGHNWTPYFKYIISEVEGNAIEEDAVEEAVLYREMELREKLKHCVIGDILADNILALNAPESFDIVSCNLCLEVPAKTVDDYKRNVKRLSTLVKPGGFVLSLVILESSFYSLSRTNEQTFIISLSEHDVREAYEKAGFTIVHSNIFAVDESRNVIDGSKANMFIVGQKQ